MSEAERRKLLAQAIQKRKNERKIIVEKLKENGSLTVKQIVEMTDLSPAKVVHHMIGMRKAGLVSEIGEKEEWYIYKLAKEDIDMSML